MIAALLLLLAMVAGCDREDAPAPTPRRNPTTATAAAAAPEHYVPPAGADTAPRPAFTAVAPAPRPTGPLAADISCVSAACHATLATAAYIHGPVSEGACETCHAPDAGNHTYPIKADLTQLCKSCHAVDTDAGGAHQHAALKDGCITCHQPHVATSKFLLNTDTVEQLCQSCHDVPLQRFAHEPFAEGQCTLCHQPHRADNAMLLRGGEGADHCLTCHKDVNASFANATVVHEPARRECTTCHSPHATEQPHVLREPIETLCLSCHSEVEHAVKQSAVPHGAMDAERSCAHCHSGHASAEPDLMLARMDKVCLTCHAGPVEGREGRKVAGMKQTLENSAFLHGPIRAGDCASCHGAHGAANSSLLTAAFPDTFYTEFAIDKYALCFNCHERELVLTEKTDSLTNFRDGNRNLHYLHVHRDDKGRSCKTCHAMHGSDQPNHVAAEVPFEGSRWAMPMGYEKDDSGGACTPGCHDRKSYNRAAAADAAAPAVPTTQGVP